MALQMSMYDGEKRAWNWEKYVACQVKYNIILANLMKYCYQCLDPESKVQYLLNGIRYDKLSTAVAAVRENPDKYENDFDAVIAFLTQYIYKKATKTSVKVASITQTRPAKRWKTSTSCSTFEGMMN